MNQNINKILVISGGVLLVILVVAILRRGILRNGEPTVMTAETSKTEESEEETTQIGEAPIDIVTPGSDPDIRVQICSDGYQGKYHESVRLVCSTDYTVAYGDTVEEHTADEAVWFTPEDEWLAVGAVTLTPKEAGGAFSLPELKRDQNNPTYQGTFIIENTDNGILVVNVVNLETYLCSVVPSEMPSSYSLEALKAQAVCARTYAMKHILQGRSEGAAADVDDSVSYQVYNNIARSKSTDAAVRETQGQVLMCGEELIDALYYSTSCGVDLTEDYSEEAVFCAFMQKQEQDSYEQSESWYRWKTYYSLAELTALAAEAGLNDIGAVSGVAISSRDENGAAAVMELTGESGTAAVEGEYHIRKLLQTTRTTVTLQDGSTAPNLGMLPSGFFYFTEDVSESGERKGYHVTGGGYGHGIGMSQNGARHMADAGMSYDEILMYYYG